MSPFGLKFSQMILHTETSTLMYNWSFICVVLHKPTVLPSTFKIMTTQRGTVETHEESIPPPPPPPPRGRNVKDSRAACTGQRSDVLLPGNNMRQPAPFWSVFDERIHSSRQPPPPPWRTLISVNRSVGAWPRGRPVNSPTRKKAKKAMRKAARQIEPHLVWWNTHVGQCK